MGLIRSLFASRDEDCPANESEAGCAEDAIASHTAPSSQAMHPRWSSVLSPATPEKQQDYEHQAVGVMLSSNELSLNYAITTQEILNIYAKHWNIEVFFRSCKQNPFDKCQLCKKQGVTRMWLILSRTHFLCCTVSGCVGSFDEGCNYFRNRVLQEIFLKMLSLHNRSIFVRFFGFAHS